MRNPIKAIFRALAILLSRFGIIDAERGKRTADLSWPRILTGFARLSQRTADVAMVGIVTGPAGIAGIAFATVYWEIGNSLSLGLAGGTLNQVSQRFGASQYDRIDLAVKQSVWIGIALGLLFTLVYWVFPHSLIGLLTNDSTTIEYGATYLQILSLAMIPNYLNTISSRTLAGADNTWIPMSIRSGGAAANLVLNALLIFGLGLGLFGAALGTAIAELLVTVGFGIGFLRGRAPAIGLFPVELNASPPFFDPGLIRELLVITAPLMARRLAERAVKFPLLAVIAMFGPAVVAAFEVSRRVRNLMHAPGWGFNLSVSSFVGQELGVGNELEAEAYAYDVLRFMLVIYLFNITMILIFARPITYIFVQDPSAVDATVPFVRIAAVSLLGMGIDSTSNGILRATGDTRWPLYGKFVGLYFFMIPLAYLGTVTALGIWGIYFAVIAETVVPAFVSWYRFQTGKWKEISRSYRPEATD